jgi:hypothetical protein
MMNWIFLIFLITSSLAGLQACGSGFGGQGSIAQDTPGKFGGTPVDPNPSPAPGPSATPAPGPSNNNNDLGICGTLNFDEIVWPTVFDLTDKRSLALSFNITGSFEGGAGWTNLANNFDGEGMSLGLLQQNLGTGSLQPLLLNMVQKHPDVMARAFAPMDLASLESMLKDWNGTALMMKAISIQRVSPLSSISETELFPDTDVLSTLDMPMKPAGGESGKVTTVSTSSSVQWAKSNLFASDGVSFVPRWKTSFKTLAASAEYRSLQVSAALNIYNRAVAYYKYFGFSEMRMSLLMFDFVTQNGGFTLSHEAQYKTYLSSHVSATEQERAQALLEIRLKSVRPEYVTDVRQRKTAIIVGAGIVHGASRNLPKEYCYRPAEVLTDL